MEFRKHFKRLEHIGAKLVRLTKAYCFLEVLLSQKGRRHMAIGAVILSAHTTRRVIMTVATRGNVLAAVNEELSYSDEDDLVLPDKPTADLQHDDDQDVPSQEVLGNRIGTH